MTQLLITINYKLRLTQKLSAQPRDPAHRPMQLSGPGLWFLLLPQLCIIHPLTSLSFISNHKHHRERFRKDPQEMMLGKQ